MVKKERRKKKNKETRKEVRLKRFLCKIRTKERGIPVYIQQIGYCKYCCSKYETCFGKS